MRPLVVSSLASWALLVSFVPGTWPGEVAAFDDEVPATLEARVVRPQSQRDKRWVSGTIRTFYGRAPHQILQQARPPFGPGTQNLPTSPYGRNESALGDPTINMNAMQLIQHWGYEGSEHAVQTEDGYILTVHRLGYPGQRGPTLSRSKRPCVVFMQHGFLQTADQWMLRGPEHDLAFLLVNQGCDVWMGNFRGNFYSKRHVKLSPFDNRFWDFSWHENAVYDIPACLDYIAAVTGQPSLFYIGHSMGCSTLLAFLSERPEYNSRLRASFLMAPVVLWHRLRGLAAVGKVHYPNVVRAWQFLHSEIFPRTPSLSALTTALCQDGAPSQQVCVELLSLFEGRDPVYTNKTLVPSVLAHYPAGGSLGQLVLYAQHIIAGKFQQYDFGSAENQKRYGKAEPPEYNLQNVRSPIVMLYSAGDYLTHYKDVEEVSKLIPGLQNLIKTPWSISHGGFMWAKDSYKVSCTALTVTFLLTYATCQMVLGFITWYITVFEKGFLQPNSTAVI